MRLGLMLRNLRKARGVSQDSLAKSMGVTSQTVSRWEKGETFPDTTLLPFLASYFRVSVDYLLGLMDGPTDATLLRTNERYRTMNRAAAERILAEMRRTEFPRVLSGVISENKDGVFLEVEREYGEWQNKR